MKVAFLDRDGTLNVEVDFLHKPEDVALIQGAKEFVQDLVSKDYQLIMITNQSGIGRGYFELVDLQATNHELFRQLNVDFLEIYYCPHHPEAKINKFRANCDCRKPKPGMFMQALQKYPQIDLKSSFMVGDSLRDCQAAAAINLKSFLLAGPKCSSSPIQLPSQCLFIHQLSEIIEHL